MTEEITCVKCGSTMDSRLSDAKVMVEMREVNQPGTQLFTARLCGSCNSQFKTGLAAWIQEFTGQESEVLT